MQLEFFFFKKSANYLIYAATVFEFFELFLHVCSYSLIFLNYLANAATVFFALEGKSFSGKLLLLLIGSGVVLNGFFGLVGLGIVVLVEVFNVGGWSGMSGLIHCHFSIQGLS